MFRTLSISSLLVLSLANCSKHSAPLATVPSEVDARKVQSVLVTSSTEQAATCQAEVVASGGKVLYQGSSGVLLSDLPVEKLNLGSCEAQPAPNSTLELRPSQGDRTPPPDLSTLMKLIPAEEMGARTFIRANPDQDGRGVRIAILDTGVEIDHPILRQTPTGELKVIAFEDFSGEGTTHLVPTSETFDGIDGSDFHRGKYPASSLKYSEDVSKADEFTDLEIISYVDRAGQRAARIDTDGDSDYSDETELHTYAKVPRFTKIGKKKTLTTSITINDEGTRANLCFDDGTHGTHVAGIAAGYEAGGLVGVAPGAQIVAVKIGDNRLSGGSTTTASMLLAIDYAVEQKAQVINLSYGIRGGSNVGKSTIDAYVDKVAKEAGVLFSISAGNEGPGLLTVGTPAGARLALTNAAYVSKETARNNYGYAGVEDDNTWFFSSVGPLFDGGWKPSLLAPGSAVSAVPIWDKAYQNYRGTSMASPQVTGGLALVLSAAKAQSLPNDRVSVTASVYESAKRLPNLLRIEQGHGLMQIPQAVESLRSRTAQLPVEYAVSVNSPTAPNGKGQGIFLRGTGENLPPFTATIAASFPVGTPTAVQDSLRTFRLRTSAPWIKTVDTFWLNSVTRSFQIQLDPSIFKNEGLHSEVLEAIDESTGRVAFEVPVTVVVPRKVSAATRYAFTESRSIKVGHTHRFFLEVPAGVTAATVDLSSDGPVVWGQLLDPEGRKQIGLRDSEPTEPMPLQLGQSSIRRSGMFEFDVTAPPYNSRATVYNLRIQFYGLQVQPGVSPAQDKAAVQIENLLSTLKLVPEVVLKTQRHQQQIHIAGKDVHSHTISVSKQDKETFSEIAVNVKTAKAVYDLMTDYPYRLFSPKSEVVDAGGFELDSDVLLELTEESEEGDYRLDVQGAFTKATPANWSFELIERRVLRAPKSLAGGNRITLQTNQATELSFDRTTSNNGAFCPMLVIKDTTGRLLQETEVCY